MSRRTGLLPRAVHNRDARLFVIATEGQETEPRYFEAIQARGLVPRTKVKLLVLATEQGRSSVHHLVERVEGFMRENGPFERMDQVWLVLDTDLHGGDRTRHLSELATLSKQKGWGLAVSSPCFELWLLLHVSDELASVTTRCESVIALLRGELGSYSKSATPEQCLTSEGLSVALERARRIDSGEAWSAAVSTGMHRLMGELHTV